jgi:hypothetical protein
MGPEAGLLTYAMLATAAASTAAAAGGYASYQQGKAAEASAEYEAEVAELNARNARAEAGEAEEQQRRAARSALANMRGAAAERGIDFAQSSAWDLYRQSAMDAEFDALTIRRKGEVQARGLVAQADGARFAAKQAGQGARYGAAASALATAAAAANGYGTYRYRMAGRTTGAGEVD